MDNSSSLIKVEVAHALPDVQSLLVVEVEESTEIKDVIQQSEILQEYPDLVLDELKVGIFGKLAKMNQIVRDRDRIEIYRPLIADPKEVRKRRAAEGKRLKKGGANAPDK